MAGNVSNIIVSIHESLEPVTSLIITIVLFFLMVLSTFDQI